MAESTITLQEPQGVPTCNNTSVGIIVWRAGCLLLLERQKFPFGIACPAGHVEAGETFAQAAARELREETGLVAVSLRQVAEGTRFNRCRRPGGDWHHWRIYEATVDEAQELRWNAEESRRLGWFTPEQVEALAQRSRAYQGQLLSEEDWQAAPGLEIVWFHWLHTIGVLSEGPHPASGSRGANPWRGPVLARVARWREGVHLVARFR
jgi:ADP-ribose pyrophosphatase YjhB (NUDIX family)